jgi:small subunit ribosomal protein S1
MSEDNIHLGNENNQARREDDEFTTMAELLAQEENELFRVVQAGEMVKGVVASKRPGEILIDIGAKSEGMVDPRDLENFSPEELAAIKVGDTVPAYVLSAEGDEEGYHITLSLSQARAERDWDEAERLFEAGEVIESSVIGNNKGGLIVNFGQVRGFVPGSQLVSGQFGGGPNRADRWNQLTGEKLRLKIIEVDRNRNRLILSERAAAEESRKDKAKLLAELTEGEVHRGRVTSLADFGAFVDIGGIDGLIHLSELAWTRISHPREVLKVGDEIDVYILNVDLNQQRVALSLKRLQPEPWSQVFDYYHIDQVVNAVITKLTNFGAFARIDDRIEGLIHISEITNKNISHPRDVLSEGQEVQVRIIHIDPDRRRMGLSIKQVEGYEEWLDYQETKEDQPEAEAKEVEEPAEAAPADDVEEEEEEETVEA